MAATASSYLDLGGLSGGFQATLHSAARIVLVKLEKVVDKVQWALVWVDLDRPTSKHDWLRLPNSYLRSRATLLVA